MYKRPLVILLFSVVFLLLSVLNYYNPLLSLLYHFTAGGSGSLLESAFASIRLAFNFVFSPSLLPVVLGGVVAVFISLAALMSLLLSGYFYIVSNELEGEVTRRKREFLEGIRKYFFKNFFATIIIMLSVVAFIFFITVTAVPALVITKAWLTDKPHFATIAIFVNVITICVIFLGGMFLRTYFLFWYPSIYRNKKKAFSRAKHCGELYFWRMVGRLALFDLVFIAAQSLFVVLNILNISQNGIPVLPIFTFVLNWAFDTLFFSVFFVYIFLEFSKYKEG